jgi:hypothetical protein
MKSIYWTLLSVTIGMLSTRVARAKSVTPVQASFTEAVQQDPGRQLEARYARQLKELKAELNEAVPLVREVRKAAYLKARQVEVAAEAHKNAQQEALNKNKGAVGLLNHRKAWIGRAIKGVAAAKKELKRVRAMPDDGQEKAAALQAAKAALDKIQANYDMAATELKKSQDAVAKAKREEPRLTRNLELAKKALAKAQAKTPKAVDKLRLGAFLASDTLDAKLAKFVILSEATPRGLAKYAEQGKEQAALVDELLADSALMIQMAVADGATKGQYGQAMKIYTDIQKVTTKAKQGALQRLALAISLEHAVPVTQRNATGKIDGAQIVDPVKRYLHFEKAYLDGELDPGFKVQSAWDYRFVVDGTEPDETLTWGREMLHNYRPDHIATSDYRWRYVAAVRTEVKYGSGDNKYDKPELQFFQNILMNGGVCGRRAFFGRFILRSFGVPTTARPSRGHAALTHWTPEGWVVCLGGGWGAGWTKTRYKQDRDFLANTQARTARKAFLEVKRAQWIGSVAGEKPVYGFFSGNPGFWYGVSLYQQRAIIEDTKAVALAAVGTDIGEANESKVKEKIQVAKMTEADRKITVGKDGVISIPAAACSKPTNNTRKIQFTPSNLGGMQLHYGRQGAHGAFEYTFDAPKAGPYKLTARVVTPSWKQHLFVAANGAKKPIDIALPFTVGMWDKTAPVEITLAKGKNVLTFTRDHPGLKGVTIKDFTLTPVD